MRKYKIGILIGVLLSIPLSAYGQEIASLIGKSVQAENNVIVNGEELEVKAINIGGTTYSPNRAIANALGLDIKFKDNKVIFDSKAGENTAMDETSFKGLKAIDIDGETYFSWKDYLDKFLPLSFGLAYNNDSRTFTYVATESAESSEIKKEYLQFNQDEPGAVYIYNSATFINIKYYREPSDFVK